MDKQLDKEGFSMNLLSDAFKDIKLNSLPTDKAQKPLPKQGGEYIFDRAKTKQPKNLVNDLPCLTTKSGHGVLNNINHSNKNVFRDPNLKNSSNFSNESHFDSVDLSRRNERNFVNSNQSRSPLKK
jgi:hypothetical protein